MSAPVHLTTSSTWSTPDPRYEALAEPLKANMSPKEYAWLPDEAKATLEEDMTTPGCVE